MSNSILVTGGARSGKSHFAQELAEKSGKTVLFVATATAGDEEMRQRIAEHRKTRPASWSTLEATTHIGRQITDNIGGAETVIVDCITLLINNILLQYDDIDDDNFNALTMEKEITTEINELTDCIDRTNADFLIVTNEVGLGLVPANKTGRLYRDLLGKANQLLARHCNEVYLLVAGMPLLIKPDNTR